MEIKKEEITKFKNIISSTKSALILTHEYPDGDALGSALAAFYLLKALGVKAKILFQKINKEDWAFIDFLADLDIEYDKDLINVTDYDLVLVVDSSNPQRLGLAEDLLATAKLSINIDHHVDNSRFATWNFVEEATSVGEILYFFFNKLKIVIPREVAYCLLVSIITDTGRFRFSNTTREIFLIVADLFGKVKTEDYFNINKNIYSEVSLNKSKLMGEVINKLIIYHDNIAFSYIDVESAFEDGLIDALLSIKNMIAAVLVRKNGDILKLSFRSKRLDVNVRELAALFGGGGHIQAAGAKVAIEDLDTQLADIKEKVATYFSKYCG